MHLEMYVGECVYRNYRHVLHNARQDSHLFSPPYLVILFMRVLITRTTEWGICAFDGERDTFTALFLLHRIWMGAPLSLYDSLNGNSPNFYFLKLGMQRRKIG